MGLTQKGDFEKTERFLNKLSKKEHFKLIEKYAQLGVEALKEATPKRTGKTSESWSYEIEQKGDDVIIHWNNSNDQDHVNIAMIIQTGHGTRQGYYVEGVDYINPALAPVFLNLADKVWKEVSMK